jgi:hypothetical protein
MTWTCWNRWATKAALRSLVKNHDVTVRFGLLREMEVIKQIDMLQDMHNFDNGAEQAKNTAPQKPAPGKAKETTK